MGRRRTVVGAGAARRPAKLPAMNAAATNPYLDIHPEVAAALADGRPVVALESTIISHGMP